MSDLPRVITFFSLETVDAMKIQRHERLLYKHTPPLPFSESETYIFCFPKNVSSETTIGSLKRKMTLVLIICDGNKTLIK